MKIEVSNLGALKWAEFTLGDLTIICGGNNTGKTYATYALYGFLDSWRKNIPIHISDDKINQLSSDGFTRIDLSEYLSNIDNMLKVGCDNYSKELASVFASTEEKFKSSKFQVFGDLSELLIQEQYANFHEQHLSSSENSRFLSVSKAEENLIFVVSLLISEEQRKNISNLTGEKDSSKFIGDVARNFIEGLLLDFLFGKYFPQPFIASAERTGAAIFRKELDFARNRLLEEMSKKRKDFENVAELFFTTAIDLYTKDYYALPIKKNIDFFRKLEVIAKQDGHLKKHSPEILEFFNEIIGGAYSVTSNDELYYLPNNQQIKLTVDESSSAVRSLLDIGFYLKHLAKPGDILMVDEPELNLHPENQRKVARLFARLMNIGIKVFITTHSDYIIKELNTLIMLNHDKPHLKMIMKEEGYQQAELIRADQVRVYMAEKDAKGFNTLTAADIDPEMGIEARTFDSTIDTMNSIQRDIVWGGE